MTHQNYATISYLPENENLMRLAPNTEASTLTEATKKHRAMYPEVHYKLKPFIAVTCDAIKATGMMPSQQELDNITDNIYDEFCNMHPDMADYMKSEKKNDSQPDAVPAISFGGFRPRFDGFRRRGLGRDLIGGLLLSELLERNRSDYPYYPYYPYDDDSYYPYY